MRSVDACAKAEWTVYTWKKDGGEDPTVKPFTCKSWRHDGACRQWCGACDFARVAQAIGEHSHWTYLILTYPHKKWPNVAELFRFGVVSWSRLRKRLTTKFGEIKYIQTWEIHRSTYPHVNVIISNANLHEHATEDFLRVKAHVLEPMATACGFGFVKWCEPLLDRVRMASYLTKLSLELTGAHHKNQVPINAPPHFRRLRASRKLLPKRVKDDTITGRLFFSNETIINGYVDEKWPDGNVPIGDPEKQPPTESSE